MIVICVSLVGFPIFASSGLSSGSCHMASRISPHFTQWENKKPAALLFLTAGRTTCRLLQVLTKVYYKDRYPLDIPGCLQTYFTQYQTKPQTRQGPRTHTPLPRCSLSRNCSPTVILTSQDFFGIYFICLDSFAPHWLELLDLLLTF